MPRSTPRSIRFDDDVDARLRAYVAARPGLSTSAAANKFIGEGLRMADHPAIVFRDGPAGRRAVVGGGPDVWEIVRAVKSARTHEGELDGDETVALVARNTGTSERSLFVSRGRFGARRSGAVGAGVAWCSGPGVTCSEVPVFRVQPATLD